VNRTNGTQVNNSKYQNTPEPVEQRIGTAKHNYNDAKMDYKGTKKQVKVDKKQYPTYGHQGTPKHYGTGHPPVPPAHSYTSAERYARTQASSIVVYTSFPSILDARQYVERLLYERYYSPGAYVSQNRIDTDMTLIPTGYNTSTLFSMHFRFYRTCNRRIKVVITAEWCESSRAYQKYGLIYQPDSRYATYYAWNVLEDIAYCLPHSSISYRR